MALDPMALKSLAIELAAAMPPPMPFDIEFDRIDVSPRAVKIAHVMRIAKAYDWPDAIPHFLRSRGVSHICDLSGPQLDDLAQRMDGYVDAAMTGCSLADCLPAN